MAVYVDDAFVRGSWGRWQRRRAPASSTAPTSCNYASPNGLGSSAAGFNPSPGRPEHDHYDLTASLRAEAIALGAVSWGWRDTARRNIRLRRLREGQLP